MTALKFNIGWNTIGWCFFLRLEGNPHFYITMLRYNINFGIIQIGYV